MDNKVKYNLDSYVDDSKLKQSFSTNNVDQSIINLEEDLHSTGKWCLEHQLLINPDEIQLLTVRSIPILQKLPTEMSLKFP